MGKMKWGSILIGLLAFICMALSSCDRKDYAKDKTVTTLEIVSQRRAEQDVKRIDNVYYTMDETVLISILNKLGTHVTKREVVFEYESNISYYLGLEEGANNVNEYKPDDADIPKEPKPIPDEPIISLEDAKQV